MSYDIQVFSIEAPIAPAWQKGRRWQITVDGPLNVEAEDIPAQVRSLLPGLRFLTEFHLEGDGPESALKKMMSMARHAARSARGVIVDPQQDTVETPRGVQRLVFEPESADGPLLQLNWFVHDEARLAKALSGELLDLFQRTIPEILPRRYGLYEPPQFRLAKDGIAHLRQFLDSHVRDFIVWYCHKPCRYLFTGVPERVGGTPRGFRCGRLTLDIDGRAATDGAWRVELTRLWVAVADVIQPFYAEIRTGECPTKGWWWNGIPAGTPSAVLVGEPYLALWPEFPSTARSTPMGLRYVEQFSNPVDGDASTQVPAPPHGIAQPPQPWRQTVFDPDKPEDLVAMFQPNRTPYPEVWPFEAPETET